ncbi:hypothetical protein SLS53_005806 [Cytospora paraplurivora]|uniref:Uncharacterized protein n=1 Tax=Cytospora paraplurivora TaxID=2898453 RepID=A0AAN9U772_9PEZI
MMYGVHSGMAGLYKLQTGWTSPPTSIDGSMSRGQSISSGLALMGVDGGPVSQVDPSMTAEVYGPGIPWTPPSDISTPFTETFTIPNQLPQGHSRSHSYDVRGSAMSWTDTSVPELSAFNQASTPVSVSTVSSNFFPSPTATPNLRPAQPRPKSTPATCSRCMRRSGTHTAAMLLATVMGTITSSYKKASQSYFDQGSSSSGNPARANPAPTTTSSTGASSLGVTLGAYTANSEDSRWLELEILARELRKLEEVYANFREVCSELSEDPEVSRAMISYLGQSLGSTMQVVSHHRNGNMMFS